ncbi:hypothetical protein K435DRAFT_939449, partial [Dendrothele bispora CBS 962.96]
GILRTNVDGGKRPKWCKGEEVDEERPGKRRKVEIEKPGEVDHVTAVGVDLVRVLRWVMTPVELEVVERYKLFSLYSSPPGCLLDEEGWYSVTPEAVARRIAERCRCDTIIDAFCGIGGNAIQFALTCNRVITFDISLERLQLARHNAMIYGVEGRIEFVLGDFVSWARSFVHREKRNEKRGEGLGGGSGRKIDVVF